MRTFKSLALATVLSCITALCLSCSSDDTDTPAPLPTPAPENQEAKENRAVLISHIESNARQMAENFREASFNATSQVYSQLLELMEVRDKHFITNLQAVLSAIATQKALAGITPVAAESELAKMGFLAYVTVDNTNVGARVVFDGKGGCRLSSADHLEFIFPATVGGIGTTLFKVAIEKSNDYYQSVSDATFNRFISDNLQSANLKRLAVVSQLSKSITMTLTGFIDNQELTLSKSIINLELPDDNPSAYVSYDTSSFKLTGKQSAYLNADHESVLDFSLSMTDTGTTFTYGFTRNGTNIISCEAHINSQLSQQSQNSQLPQNILAISDLKEVTIRILNDLTLSATVTDGESLAQSFPTTIKQRQQYTSADEASSAAALLNKSLQLQLSCPQMKQPEAVQLYPAKKEDNYILEPGLKDLDNDGFIPISQLLDAQTLEYINQPFMQSFTPVGTASGSLLKFYSVFLQLAGIN